jgi:uncharacterized protein YcaQ/predicted GIY-YIG superfamily endonuclease
MTRAETLTAGAARRLALAAQGFQTARPRGRVDLRHVRRTLLRMGLLQLDYVNVLIPSHYLVLFSRLGAYERIKLDTLVYQRREFMEHWAHEASIVPAATWPLLRYRREAHRVRPWGFEKFLDANPHYVQRMVKEIRRRGPLSADDLPDPDGPRRIAIPGWTWGTGVKRQTLEALFGRGVLAASRRRRNFSREYDLAERVVPATERRRRIGPTAAQRALLMQAAAAHGIGTTADLADYFRMPVAMARPRIDELVAAGDLRQVQVEDWAQPAYMPGQARVPRRIAARALLSPFDPVVWHRPRTARLFQFEYRFEIFIPQAKRRWGTYVLPFLMGDRLVARVDVKAAREKRRLEVPAAYLEDGAAAEPVAKALAGELHTLAGWLGLPEVKVGRRGNLARALATAVRSAGSLATATRTPAIATRSTRALATSPRSGQLKNDITREDDALWSIYMLRCGDQSLYTGITTDLTRRLAEHRGRQGRGARYLRGRGPLRVVLTGPVGSHSLALRVELGIKKMSRREKEHLVAADGGLQDFIHGLRLLGDGAHLG